jgi:AraC family ethanolamine operon transcriptional activator
MVTRELGEYADSIRDIWDAEVDQLDITSGITRCRYVTDGESVLYDLFMGVASFQQGCLRGDRLAIAIPNEAACEGRWFGMTHPDSGVGFVHSSESTELMFPVNSENRVAIIGWSRFAADFESLAEAPIERYFPRRRYFLHIGMEPMQELRKRWGRLFNGGRISSVDLAGALIEPVVETLLKTSFEVGGERRADSHNFRRMVERLHHSELPESPGQLALGLGISLRTLHNACMHGSGHSPGQLLKLLRLNRARRELLETQYGERTVAELAQAHGFTELGRFAGEYRKIFGELPSETLRLRSKRPRIMRVGSIWS